MYVSVYLSIFSYFSFCFCIFLRIKRVYCTTLLFSARPVNAGTSCHCPCSRVMCIGFTRIQFVARRLPCSISLADDFEKTGFEVCAKLALTFCLQAFSDSGSLMNKNAANLKVKFLYCCVINSEDLDTFVK